MAQYQNKPSKYGTLEIVVPAQKLAQRRHNLAQSEQYEEAQVVESECRSVQQAPQDSILAAVAGLVVAVVLGVVESTRISITQAVQEHSEMAAKRRRWQAIRQGDGDEIKPRKRPGIGRESGGKSCGKYQQNTIVNYGGNITINQY
jgi:hypothetical protein